MSGRMVVGYDGSADSRVALSWAVAMARKWEVNLVAVSCWIPPMAPGLPQLPPDFLASLEEHTGAALSAALRECGAFTDGLPVDTRVIQSPPADALLGISRPGRTSIRGDLLSEQAETGQSVVA